jgi:phosphoglycerate dehydrogenase-like enzyme
MKIVAITGLNLDFLLKNVPQDLQSQIDLQWVKKADEAKSLLPEAEAIVTAGSMDPSILDLTPKLRWVQTLSAGVDQLPLERFSEREITVTNMSGVHQIQMSELTISLMLQWVRKSNLFHLNQLNQVWDHRITPGELFGKTIGIIGVGSIGEAVARKAKAFDMHVIGFNRTGDSQPYFDEIVTGDDGLSYLLQQSDFVVLLLPSTNKTYQFLRAEHFEQMKESAFLINLARGNVVHETEMIEALRHGRIAGAALDVFDQEPLPLESPLWKLENVIITPHIAGASVHYVERAAPIFYHNIREFLAGRPLRNKVDLAEGY